MTHFLSFCVFVAREDGEAGFENAHPLPVAWIPACAGMTMEGMRSDFPHLVIPAKAGIQTPRVGAA